LASVPNMTAAKPSRRHDHRIIIHFVSSYRTWCLNTSNANIIQDYDCFYASVFENENPALKSVPLVRRQKIPILQI
jgi:DNA polymerase iota